VPTLFLRYPSCRLLVLSLFALGLAFATADASRAETVDFNGLRAYPVGANPKGLSIGDCNGDGAPDLVTAAQNSNEVVILQNVGDGTFEFGGGRTNVSQPVGATCADFNGDGLVDIAAASRLGDITFYFQDGMGAFNPGGTRPGGAEPVSLIGADVNGDTLEDLVAVDSTRETLTIYLGTGSAALPPFITVKTGIASPRAAAVADFDLDGFADIAVAGATAPYVVVLYGSGVGFAQRGTIPNPFSQTRRPTRGQGIAAADLNNDTYPDLALLSSDGVITLFRGSATGQFAYLDAFSVSTDAESIALSDLNGDTLVDLALLASDTNSAQVFLAVDYAQFDLPTLVSVTAVSNGFGPVVSRTVLSDPTDPLTSVTQLMAADTNAQAVSLVEQSDPTALSTNPLVSVQDAPTALSLGDVSGDGIADVVVVGKALKRGKIPKTGPFQLRVLLGNSSGQYFEVPSSGGGTCGNGVLETGEQCDDGNLKGNDGCSKLCTIELGKLVPSLEIIDIDADGRGDIVLTDARGRVLALVSDGQGRFWQIRKLGDARKKTPAALGDFDGNGTTDVAFVSKNAKHGAITLLNNLGSGFFVTTPVSLPDKMKITGSILAADFDRNGLPDLAAGLDKNRWAVLFNDGSGPNRPAVVALPKAYKTLSRMVAADFDEDGWLDLVTNYGPKVPTLFFRGSATGAFSGGEAIGAAGTLTDPFAVDLDQDDHQDIVSCSAAGGLSCRVFYGNGAGQFGAAALPSSTAVGREPRAAAAGDLDQDGFADVVGISRVDDVAVVLFGGTPAQNSRVALPTGSRPSDVEILDLNGDSHLDFIVANEASRDLSIFLNQTNRQFLSLARVSLPSIPNSSLGLMALASGDIDNNGTIDLAVVQAGGQAGGTVTPLINVNGVGLAVSGSVPVGNLAWGIAVGKLNGDDVLDIVTANRNDNTFSVLLSQGNGTYSRSDVDSGGIRATDVAVADLDGDGFGDVIVTNEMIDAQTSNYGNVVTFLNDGNGGFPGNGSKHVRGREIPRSICAGDFDNDGQKDVAVASLASNDIMVLFGAGNGTWRADERLFPVGDGALSVSCREADGDDRTDIAFGRRSGSEVGVILTNQ
jgi:cysteine-rich repeat protein